MKSSLMPDYIVQSTDLPTIALHLTTAQQWDSWRGEQSEFVQNQLTSAAFKAKAGKSYSVLNADGKIDFVIGVIDSEADIWSWAEFAESLTDDTAYKFITSTIEIDWNCAVLGWSLGCYRFDRYKKKAARFPTLLLDEANDIALGGILAESICLTRNLVNEPANVMTPKALANAVQDLAKETKGATYSEIVGDDLLEENYPTIHAVGRACVVPPRLAELHWGDTAHPKLTLVGKGVCFDTGGLNIKGGSSMGLMKKDMGGAAFMIGLARAIMQCGLKVHLHLLIPTVENSISGNAYRPQDVIKTRKGITVEISNTDAEGRLILCDALAKADDEKPDLLIDAATLTGAARVAVGAEIPAFFSTNDIIANEVARAAKEHKDMLWQLPLWEDYRYLLDSEIADIDHSASTGYGGAITAALYLKEFVTQTENWVHIDMMAWNNRKRPGRPVGGEAQGLRGLLSFLTERYGKAA